MIQPVACPICQKQLAPEAFESKEFPFCSVRCQQIDLARWLDGKYAIVQPLDPEQIVPGMDGIDSLMDGPDQ